MPFKMVSGVGGGMGVLDAGLWVVIVEGNGLFWGEFGVYHCNQWGLGCVVVRKCVNRSRCRWGGEWGQSRDGCVRWESTCLKGRAVSWGFCPTGLNGVFFNRNVFDSCVKNRQYFRMDNVSLESTFHWLSETQSSSRSMLGFTINRQNVTVI